MSNFPRTVWLVARREFSALLTNPLFFVLSGVFFLLAAWIFVVTLYQFAQGAEGMTVNVTASVVRPTFFVVHFFLLVQVPLLTMRGFAEDRSSGVLDLLQTTPMTDWALLLGKFFGTVAAMLIYLLLTLLFPLVTSFLGTVDWAVIVGSAIALLLSSAAYVAFGLFCSSLTESQVIAAVISYVGLFLLVLTDIVIEDLPQAWLRDMVRHFSVNEHLTAILDGLLAPMDVMYFVGLTAIFLFLTARWLEAARWRA